MTVKQLRAVLAQFSDNIEVVIYDPQADAQERSLRCINDVDYIFETGKVHLTIGEEVEQ